MSGMGMGFEKGEEGGVLGGGRLGLCSRMGEGGGKGKGN